MDRRRKRKIQAYLYEKYGGICCICGVQTTLERPGYKQPIAKTMATIGHIIPKSRGGSTKRENLQLECYACNSNAGAVDGRLQLQSKWGKG